MDKLLKTKMTKKELIKRKAALAHRIHNLKLDYKDVDAEDMPLDVVEDIQHMMTEMKEIRAELDAD